MAGTWKPAGGGVLLTSNRVIFASRGKNKQDGWRGGGVGVEGGGGGISRGGGLLAVASGALFLKRRW